MFVFRHLPLPLALVTVLAAPAGAQILPLDPLLAALTGRVDTLENRVVNVDLALTANVSALNSIQAQIAIDVTAIADLDARVTVNSTLIADSVLRNDGQDGLIAGNAAAIAGNATAIAGNAAAIAANVLRDDGQDGLIAGNAASIAGNATAIAGNTAAIAANVLRDDGQDGLIAGNVAAIAGNAAAIAANVLRDDGQDGLIAGNAAAIAGNTAAIAANVLRDDGQDGLIARNTTAIAGNAAAIAANGLRDDAQAVSIAATVLRVDQQDGRIAANTAGLGTLRADVEAGRAGLVRQAAPAGPITVGAATGGTSVFLAGTGGDRRLSGVADGVAGNDAATMSQLAARSTATLAAANDYTDRSMAAILDANERIINANNGVLRRDLRAIASGTTAIAGLPQSFIPGKGMVGMSMGGTGGEMAVALGLSKAFDGDNPLVLRGGLAFDTRRGDATYNASVGIHF